MILSSRKMSCAISSRQNLILIVMPMQVMHIAEDMNYHVWQHEKSIYCPPIGIFFYLLSQLLFIFDTEGWAWVDLVKYHSQFCYGIWIICNIYIPMLSIFWFSLSISYIFTHLLFWYNRHILIGRIRNIVMRRAAKHKLLEFTLKLQCRCSVGHQHRCGYLKFHLLYNLFLQ